MKKTTKIISSSIEESQPFTENNILKENLSLTHTPDYSTAKPYFYKVSPDKIFLEMDLN
ncbi:hypothetical protein [Lactococcus lactis]|uniref:hypothetical protein n=1 Tax=Lactococcus lactis TaxID=1358 RepID=UPI00223C3A8C|nr:hypothetical protein [Lactococcus lactis]